MLHPSEIMNNKIAAIAIVAVLIIAGVSIAVIYSNSSGDEDSPSLASDTRLVIYGNANGDDYLDDNDVMYLQNVLNGKNEENKFCDTNCDGRIDQEDVNFLKAILDGTASEIYYENLNGNIASVRQPVKTIGADYWPIMYGIMAIGATDILTWVDSGIYNSFSTNSIYRGLDVSNIKNFGSGFHEGYDFETIMSTHFDAIVCGSEDIYFVGIEDKFSDESKIDMIRLPFWEGGNVSSAVLTLAYLLGDSEYIENAHKFVDFQDRIQKTIDNCISKVDNKDTVLVTYLGSSTESSLEVEVECRGSGSYECSIIAGMNNLASYLNQEGKLSSDTMYYNTDQEYVIGKNPDWVIILGSGSGLFPNEDKLKTSYAVGAKYLNTTNAAKNNQIAVSGSGITSGTMQMNTALYIACTVYSDAFSDVDADAFLQEYIDNFTSVNKGLNSTDSKYLKADSTGFLYLPSKV